MNKAVKKLFSLCLSCLIIFSVFSLISMASDETKTSTSYRYEDKFLTAKLFYSDFSLISEEYFPIPGLINTDVSGENCSCMTPQGLCVTDDFVFISAYCSVEKYKTELQENISYGNNADKLIAEENHEKHNSVIYIIDRESGQYIKNMVLSDMNHVGGLATDGKNIFIAKSSDEQISVITPKQIELVLATKSLSVDVEYDYTVDCGATASFVTYHDGLLWVGVFNEKENGSLNAFSVDDKKFCLTEVTSIEIPAKANGASFTEINGETCLCVNSSYGRKNISQIYLYSVSGYATENMSLELKDTYNAPPTVQNSCVYDGKVYYIYESAATCYSEVEAAFSKKATTCAVDRVCIGDANRLFNWHCTENLMMVKITNLLNALVQFVKEFI